MPITTPPTLAPAPDVPNSNDPEVTFDSMFEAFFAYLRNTFVSTVNAIAAACFDNATSAQASATASASSAAASQASAATSLAGSKFIGDWAGKTGQQLRPASVAHIGRIWMLLADLPNIEAAEPAEGSPYWRAYDVVLPLAHVTTAAQTAVAGYNYSLEFAGSTTLTLPAVPAEGAMVWITVANGRYDNTVGRNGSTIMALAEDMLLDNPTTYQLRFINGSWRLL